MSSTIAIYWSKPSLQIVVAKGSRLEVGPSVDWDAGETAAEAGQRLSTALTGIVTGKTKAIVALGRGTLHWQHLSLPPCPLDELPDVVRLQADRDLDEAEDDVGFDYLPLRGDEHTPYQVLTVEAGEREFEKIRECCRAAHLTLDHIVPLAAGWPALIKQATQDTSRETTIYVAPQASEAAIWAMRSNHIVLFRQFQIATHDDVEARKSAIASELRRTLLALSQHSESSSTSVRLVNGPAGEHSELAVALSSDLNIVFDTVDLPMEVTQLVGEDAASSALVPLAGLALDDMSGNQPAVDLLHPRRRPPATINLRTYVLAATAAVLFVGLIGWTGYTRLQAPLEQAAVDQAELTLLQEPLEQLKDYEQRAAAIRDWNNEASNVLLHLDQLSKQFRPQMLNDEEFPLDQDVMLESFVLEKRQLTVDALARNSLAIQPLEARLRDKQYLPQRGKSDTSQSVNGYPWHVKAVIDITAESDAAAESDALVDSMLQEETEQ